MGKDVFCIPNAETVGHYLRLERNQRVPAGTHVLYHDALPDQIVRAPRVLGTYQQEIEQIAYRLHDIRRKSGDGFLGEEKAKILREMREKYGELKI